MNNAQLFKYHQDILAMRGSVYEYWFKERIEGFYHLYKQRLELLTHRLEKLSHEYFQYQDGKLLYDGNQQALPLEGKSIEEYKAKFQAIMSEGNNLIAVK